MRLSRAVTSCTVHTMASPTALSLSSRKTLLSTHTMPNLGLGTWRSFPGVCAHAVQAAIEAGYTHLDCAWTYENEAEVGEGIRKGLASTGKSRSDLFITSKIWNNHLRPEHVSECAKESIHRLQCDYLDLLLIHWPVPLTRIAGNKFAENETKTDRFYESDVDPNKDSWGAMEALVDAGLVRSLGVSNYSSAQIEDLLSKCRIKPVTDQVECHPFFNQRKLLDYLTSKGMTMTAYSPLGNLQRDDSDKLNSPLRDPVIVSIAKDKQKSEAQVILRWHLQRGHIVIPKSSSPARVVENSQLYDFELSADEMQLIEKLGDRQLRFINPPWLPGWKKYFDTHSEP